MTKDTSLVLKDFIFTQLMSCIRVKAVFSDLAHTIKTSITDRDIYKIFKCDEKEIYEVPANELLERFDVDEFEKLIEKIQNQLD